MTPAQSMTALGRALGCTKPMPSTSGRALPDKLYYSGRKLFVAPTPRTPIDATEAPGAMEREARELRERGREQLVRFFQGRYSRRLGRVVRFDD